MTNRIEDAETSEREADRLQAEITAYWDMRSKDYDDHPNHGLQSQLEKEGWLALLRELLPPPPLDILDVGTGTGFLALLMAELGHRVVGIDLAKGMLEVANSKRMPNAMARFEIGDASAPNFPDASFDAITSRHLLWTLVEPEQAFANWRKLLRPGGRIIAIDSVSPSPKPVPVSSSYSEELAKALPLRHTGTPWAAVRAFKTAGYEYVSASLIDEVGQLRREPRHEFEFAPRYVFMAIRGD
jgi:ubiquinone/menaquinone biosynthesis C-methylase UbiE